MRHLTRVAFGCTVPDELAQRLAARGPVLHLTTRHRPKRHADLIGGSLYWILRHRIVGRNAILGVEEAEGGRTDIVIRGNFITTVAQPGRAHQGWRYLENAEAPADLAAGAGGIEPLPPALAGELAAIGLL